MKKNVGLLVIMLLSFTFAANAQLKFGIKGGLNMTKMSFSDVPENFSSSNRVGFFVGPMLDAKVPIVGLGFDVALLFSTREGRVKTDEGNKNFSESGFDIPVNLKYSFGLSKLASVYLAAGPNFFFNIDKDLKIADNMKFSKKKAQVGFNVGGGVRLFTHYQLGINYNIPLSKSATSKIIDGAGEALNSSYKSKIWQVSFAYLF
jgi:hypothetical protein